VWALAGLLLLAVTATAAAAPPKDKREMQAREAYAAGRYQEALDLFVKLYAETVHPNYLRNIGRCYQNLNEPERALSSFREYLRKGRDISAKEREEIRGYMNEMEELKRQQAAAPPPPPPRIDEPKPLPPGGVPPGGGNGQLGGANDPNHPAIAVGGHPPPPQDEAAPIYTKWWFWTIVGGVVAAGVVGGVLATRSSASEPQCTAMQRCDP
jgi:tetratricopeptide (TPR) repeat protein